MSYVIDANVLMGALISGKSFYKSVFETLDPIMPDFALVEIEKYSGTITAQSRLSEEELLRFTWSIFGQITILPRYFLTADALADAVRLIGEVDPKDIAYVGLSLQTNTVLLTRDRPLYVAARQKGYRRIALFDDFLRQYR